jgi:hypothetical protein
MADDTLETPHAQEHTIGPAGREVLIRGEVRRLPWPAGPDILFGFALAILAEENPDLRDLLLDLGAEVRDVDGELVFPLERDHVLCPAGGQPLEDVDESVTSVICVCGRRVPVMPGDEENHPSIAEHRPGAKLRELARALRPEPRVGPAPAAPAHAPQGNTVDLGALLRLLSSLGGRGNG